MKKLIFILTAIIFLFGCRDKEIYVPENFETTSKNMIMSFSDHTYGKSLIESSFNSELTGADYITVSNIKSMLSGENKRGKNLTLTIN